MRHPAPTAASAARRASAWARADPLAAAVWSAEALGLLLLVSRSCINYAGPGFGSFVSEWVYALVLFLPAAACAHTARRMEAASAGLWLVGAGILAWCLGTVAFNVALEQTGVPAAPPAVNDAFWLLAIPLIYVGLAKIAPDRQGATSGMWLDGLVGGLAIASIGAAFVFKDVFAGIGDTPAAVVTLAYPLGDLTLLSLVGWLIFAGGLRRGAFLLGAAFLLDAAADSTFAYHDAFGSFDPGSIVAISYVGAAVLLAAGALRATASAEPVTEIVDEYRAVVPPALFAATGVAVLAWSIIAGGSAPGALLALAAVAGSCVRLFGVLGRAHSLEVLAGEDALTGLKNRRVYDAAVSSEILRGGRYTSTFSVVLFDLDGFKLVNDTHGHGQGDALLQEVGQVLRSRKRDADGAYRIGGDEFALILPHTSRSDATHMADAVCRRMADIDSVIVASFGVAEWPTDGVSKSTLLRHADRKLYASKSGSRRTAVGGQPGLGSRKIDDGAIERILEVARDELRMDIAYLSRWTDGDQVVEVVAGDGSSFRSVPGDRTSLALTFCRRMIDGDIRGVIPDARNHPELRQLAVTLDADIGAYIGVPVMRADGSVYGTLCCLSHAARRDITAGDESFLRVLGRLLGASLERSEEMERHHLLKTRATGNNALLAALTARDHCTASHSRATVRLSVAVARKLGLDADEVTAVEQIALLHDIGKVGISDSILQKPGLLDPAERHRIRDHPAIGADIVAAIPMLAQLAPSIRAEHERWDGTGYPDGLCGDEIPLSSRIVFACDAYEAMTTDRPYRTAIHADPAIEELRRCAGSQFDPRIVRVLVSIIELGSVAAA